MGLPEKISSTDIIEANPALGTEKKINGLLSKMAPANLQTRRIAVLLVPDHSFINDGESTFLQKKLLGTQYVFGFIPLTKLYFSHSAKSQLLETALSALQKNGYDVVTAPPTTPTNFLKGLNPQLVLSTELTEISLNAYDLIFLRNLNTSATLSVTSYDITGPKLYPLDSTTSRIDSSTFRPFGHAPILAEMFTRELEQHISNKIKTIRTFTKHRRAQDATGTGNEPLLIILPSTLPSQIDPKILSALSNAYGFRAKHGFSHGELTRVIQRGALSAAENASFLPIGPAFVDFKFFNAGCNPSSNWWSIRSHVTEMNFDGSSTIDLKISFELLRSSSETKYQYARHGRCHAVVDVNTGSDGAWISAFETVARELYLRFLQQQIISSQDKLKTRLTNGSFLCEILK